MARLKKLSSSLHIPIMDLGDLSASDLLAIDGPRFITSDSYEGATTFAVLIAYDKWKRMNHCLPDVDSRKATVSFVGDQAYMTVPVDQVSSTVWQAKSSTGLKIITERKRRKKSIQ